METSSATLAPSSVSSRLETLPGELRNHIWRFSIVREHKVPALSKVGSSPSKVTVPPLAHVSRIIRNEVLSIHYSENSFEYCSSLFWVEKDDWKEIESWLEGIGPYADVLKSLTWRCEACHQSPATQKFHGGGGTLVMADENMGLEHVRLTARFSDGICTGFDRENASYCRCEAKRDDAHVGAILRRLWQVTNSVAGKGLDIIAAMQVLQASAAVTTCWKLTWCVPCWQQYHKQLQEKCTVAARSELGVTTPANEGSWVEWAHLV